ncbi:hypothetical protein OSB71_20345 [Streptomyces sp. JHD 1]|nr:hypothetical protein [Streptomyces sp. JHD 1]MCX2971187.1 hypothetical protein [Streptomyces sp. JHD 1]
MRPREWTIGVCWRCDAEKVPVLWLGPVQSQDQGDAPFLCCEPCVRRLEALVHAHHARRDAASA